MDWPCWQQHPQLLHIAHCKANHPNDRWTFFFKWKRAVQACLTGSGERRALFPGVSSLGTSACNAFSLSGKKCALPPPPQLFIQDMKLLYQFLTRKMHCEVCINCKNKLPPNATSTCEEAVFFVNVIVTIFYSSQTATMTNFCKGNWGNLWSDHISISHTLRTHLHTYTHINTHTRAHTHTLSSSKKLRATYYIAIALLFLSSIV